MTETTYTLISVFIVTCLALSFAGVFIYYASDCSISHLPACQMSNESIVSTLKPELNLQIGNKIHIFKKSLSAQSFERHLEAINVSEQSPMIITTLLGDDILFNVRVNMMTSSNGTKYLSLWLK